MYETDCKQVELDLTTMIVDLTPNHLRVLFFYMRLIAKQAELESKTMITDLTPPTEYV